jgi:hypothetical protein
MPSTSKRKIILAISIAFYIGLVRFLLLFVAIAKTAYIFNRTNDRTIASTLGDKPYVRIVHRILTFLAKTGFGVDKKRYKLSISKIFSEAERDEFCSQLIFYTWLRFEVPEGYFCSQLIVMTLQNDITFTQ